MLPASFRFPRFENLAATDGWTGRPDLFEPLAWTGFQVRSPGAFDYLALLRLPPDATAAQASIELNGILDDAFAARPPLGHSIPGRMCFRWRSKW